MEHISVSDLARRLGDILDRIRIRGEAFLIERHNVAIAQIGPPPDARPATLRDVARTWLSHPSDVAFAADLERVNRADQLPKARRRKERRDGRKSG